ncbi:DUF3488 and transglutaminase-like domain-containing protein [Antiquaquibacter oligotrophicus]|uniref:transglutaminase family protein n=1 Tax=Antiquaquibacter oligotrophicus TaxID=2880260 RepID=UPI002AC8CF16|nr:DUF3488 and transglutaminase-like domain-containing protein [Antiquaquibacter oligotrophicus]UDF12843.1 DUF3488 and transglutaminase-like domain-containing protein [Antiquaquibacter oligotrophicus]
MSGLLLAAIGIAFSSLAPAFEGSDWWLRGMVVSAAILLAASATRSLTRVRVLASVIALVVAIVVMTFFFVPSTAIFGVIPTGESFAAFRELDVAGNNDIATQTVPAEATEGIRFLLCLGVAAVTIAVDALVQLFRVPALAGIPLLILLLVPGLIRAEFADPAPFAFVAAIWLAVLIVSSGRSVTRATVVTGAVALVAALIVPAFLPGIEAPESSSAAGGSGATASLNPIITLGADLRNGAPVDALEYRTSDDSPQYLRLTALSNFTGESWAPTGLPRDGTDIEEMGPVPGLGEGITATPLTTTVEVEGVSSRWLPVPYAASGITGLDGEWNWESEGLTVRSADSNARDQQFEVSSVRAEPSVEQLVASDATPVTGMEQYLELPDELPAIVGETAAEVVLGAGSSYERAIALQAFFRAGSFTYSEDAPVDQDFDGSGAEVLAPFLEVRSGYCVHFSSAMAAMARTLGIPSRVIVGFTPGLPFPSGQNGQFTSYQVTTENLHAWPELYFGGIGWVRFEPTPTRGVPPQFAPLDADDPSTPDVDESVPPPTETDPQPVPTPTTTAEAPENLGPDAADENTPADTRQSGIPLGLVVSALAVLVVLSPALLRALVRARRLRAVARGSALDAWKELRDTLDDLGHRVGEELTPQQLVAELAPVLDAEGAAALSRVRDAVETHAFRPAPAEPAPADLRRVLRSMYRSAGVGRSLLAVLAPRSLVRPFLPDVAV